MCRATARPRRIRRSTQAVTTASAPAATTCPTTPDHGRWDAAYDIWFDTNPHPGGQNNGEELMIWANHAGGATPYGSQVDTVRLDGASWQVWYGRQGTNPAWNTVSYVREQPTDAISVNIKAFTDDSIKRGYMQPSWYMTSVQFGFEPWVGGPGLAANDFSYTPNGNSAGNGGEDGSYGDGNSSRTLVWQGSTRCLDIKNFGTADGTRLQLWDCNGTRNQQWTPTNQTLVNPDTGKCADVAGGSTANGTPVRLWSCNGTDAQRWQVNPNGTVTNPQSGKCLDASGSVNWAPLQIWDCYGSGTQPNQGWSLK